MSYAVANREPNRTDYESGNNKPERLNDFELGWRYVSEKTQINTNIYYMQYKDQLVLTGNIDDVGSYLRANVPDSYRLGMEVDANILLSDILQITPNIALSTNKIKDFILDRDGVVQNIGDTNIAFSPTVVAGNIFTFKPSSAINISLLSKYVGEQYLSNTDTEASKLDAYFTNDLNITYTLKNNILNEEYESNGFTYLNNWDGPTSFEVQGYYPQAGINFLLGATLNF